MTANDQPSAQTDGYVTGIEYVPRYYRELNPHVMHLILLANGWDVSNPSGPFTYRGLGFGRGLSLAINAASNPHGRFYGVDFIPEHVAQVSEWSRAANLDNLDVRPVPFCRLESQSYPKFDYIA
ncbi:MAG: hypothetical protein KDE14_10035, partial [Rhodobacteraceae bacterium]|nr:hypothetical protein [Paracoccaceae bacterium]